MEKYGFIYIWYDRKHKRYYVGRHWGTKDDGYICSSTNMRNNYVNRPSDFKRKIVSIVDSKENLVIEEQKWLNMIKLSELNNRYYNKTQKATTPSTLGYKHSAQTIEKIRNSNKLVKRSDETREKNRQATKRQFDNPKARNLASIKQSKVWTNLEYREHMSIVHRGKRSPLSQETKDKIRKAQIGKPRKPHSEEAKNKVREANKNKIYINNGIVTKQHSALEQIPVGFIRGRIR